MFCNLDRQQVKLTDNANVFTEDSFDFCTELVILQLLVHTVPNLYLSEFDSLYINRFGSFDLASQ